VPKEISVSLPPPVQTTDNSGTILGQSVKFVAVAAVNKIANGPYIGKTGTYYEKCDACHCFCVIRDVWVGGKLLSHGWIHYQTPRLKNVYETRRYEQKR
jgi:hypothetical protein